MAKSRHVNPDTGLWVRKNNDSNKPITSKEQRNNFKGIRKEALEKLGSALNKLAKYDKQ